MSGRSAARFGGENGFSTSGNRGDQNSINIDGVSNKSLDNGLDQNTFSTEAVQEFNVVTQGYPAEFGGAAGGVVNAVSKSGTNKFDGYLYSFIRSDAFDKPVFNTVTGGDGVVSAVAADAPSEFSRYVTGFTLGGPVRQDKLFFFGLAEATRSNTPRLQNIVQPPWKRKPRPPIAILLADPQATSSDIQADEQQGDAEVDGTSRRAERVLPQLRQQLQPGGGAQRPQLRDDDQRNQGAHLGRGRLAQFGAVEYVAQHRALSGKSRGRLGRLPDAGRPLEHPKFLAAHPDRREYRRHVRPWQRRRRRAQLRSQVGRERHADAVPKLTR